MRTTMATENNNKNLNVPNLRFPEFSGEWEKTTLGNIGETFNGLTGKSGADFGQGSPYITYKSIFDNSRIDLSRVELVTITDQERQKGTQNKVQYGDIFFTTSSETPEEVGMTSVLLDDTEDCYLNSFCFGYRLYSKEHILPEYMRFYLRTQGVRKKLFVLAQGSTRFNISKGEVMNVSVAIPEIKEQEKIAKFLSLLEERIDTQIKIIEKLESLIRGIVETHYSQSECVNQVRISELGEPFSTMNMSKEDLSEEGNECILYGELFTTYGCVIKEVKSRTHISTNKATVSQSNDLLFPASTTVDAMSLIAPSAICKEGVILGGDLFGVHVNKNYNNEYLSYLINYIYKSKLARYAQGSTIIHLHYSDIKNATLVLPTIEEQNYLAHIMRVVEEKINIEKDMLSKLYSQKAYLLSNLFI